MAVKEDTVTKPSPAASAIKIVECARCAELEVEVKHLKRLLAERGRLPAKSGAERMRLLRERKVMAKEKNGNE